MLHELAFPFLVALETDMESVEMLGDCLFTPPEGADHAGAYMAGGPL